jgi:acyl-coenzyme A synthetase/AMP-(fatty) acid ligase
MPRYDAGLFVEAVEKYQITETLFVPPMLLSLPMAPNFSHKAMSSLRQVFCGGAHVGNGVQQQMYAALHPDARLNQIYGMTEAGWICGFHYPEKDMTGSVGRPFSGFQIK